MKRVGSSGFINTMTLCPPSEVSENKLNTLFVFLQSEKLSLDLLLYYLNKKFDHIGVRNYLVNKLYSMNEDKVTFYIPQICYLTIKNDSPELESFLYEKCYKSIPMFFLIHWSINSYGEANLNDKEGYEKVKRILKGCEISMINAKKVDMSQQQVEFSLGYDFKDQQKFLQFMQDKERRKEYNQTVNKFINNLIDISLRLKTYKIEGRKEKLKYYITMGNNVIEGNRKKVSKSDFNHSIYFNGIVIPFSNWDNSKYPSNLVVTILPHDFTCFNTKKRVPYKIVMETVDVNDFKQYSPKAPPQNPLELEHQSSTKTINDWEIVDEVYDPSATTPATTDEIHKTKLNKYQGLETYLKKVVTEETKKNEEIMKNEPQKPWLLSNIIKIPNFLGKNSKDDYKELDDEIISADKVKKPTFLGTLNKNLRKMQTINVNLQIESHLKKMTSTSMNRQSFIIKFPIRKIACRNSMYAEDSNKDNTTKKIAKRKFSMRNSEKIVLLEFLNEMKNKIGESKTEKINKINEMYKLIETQRVSEILVEKPKKKGKKPNQNQPGPQIAKARKIGPWDELWEDKSEIIKEQSLYGHFPSYKLRCMIIKGGDDLRQEIICMQLIIKFKEIFQQENLQLYLRPYEIIVTSPNSGILEFIPNTIAIDGLKKKYPNTSLLNFYKMTYDISFEEAQKNFIESFAAYSLLTYFLQIKDRHNGNILIDSKGYILHIDFGFMLALTPGGINFESAPFKFTAEYLDLMGGKESNMFAYFKVLFTEGFKTLRKHVHQISYLLEMMMKGSDLPCFTNFNLDVFKARFKIKYTDDEIEVHAEKLIEISYDNWRTTQYDNFQKMTNGIMP